MGRKQLVLGQTVEMNIINPCANELMSNYHFSHCLFHLEYQHKAGDK